MFGKIIAIISRTPRAPWGVAAPILHLVLEASLGRPGSRDYDENTTASGVSYPDLLSGQQVT